FQEPASPVSLASALARRAQELPQPELLVAPYAYRRFDADLLQDVLAQLRPDNVLVTVSAPGGETNATDPRYGTAYAIRPVTPERRAAWQALSRNPALAIAAPNPFLPEDLALKPYSAEPAPSDVPNVARKPQLLQDEGGLRLWFKQDDEF